MSGLDEAAAIDYDIHGLVGVRLVDAGPGDAAAVARQLGPLRSPLGRAPDIVVRFVKRAAGPTLNHVTFGENGFDEDGFYVLRSREQGVRVRVPFEQIGGPVEMVCQSGVPAVPLLLAIVNLSMLRHDCVPLHASAFLYQGVGILVTGWAKGGKTEALLSFIAHGASYVGDEWIHLAGDGSRMYGIPEAILVRDWHLRQVPEVRGRIERARLLRLDLLRRLQRLQAAALRGPLGRTPAGHVLKHTIPFLERRLAIRLEPGELFGDRLGPFSARPEKVFLMLSHDSSETRVERVDGAEVAKRMIASIRFEQLPLLEQYLAFSYAFPERRSEFLEHVADLQYDILRRALAGKEAYVVRHPYPVSFPDLFERMRPYCAPAAGSG